MERLKSIFKNRKEFKSALSTILARGYQYNEIKTNLWIGTMGGEKMMILDHSSGDITLKKSLKGLKIGLVTGAVIVGSVVALIMLFSESGNSISPIATLLSAFVVGAVWGGVLGFMLGSLFPLHPNAKVTDRSELKFSVDFIPHNMEDELYFKNKWQKAFY